MDPPIAPIVFKSRGARAKAAVRKRPASPPPASANANASDDSSDDSDSSADGKPSVAKRRRREAGVSVSASTDNKETTNTHGPVRFEADRTAALTDTNDATKRSDWYDEPKTNNGSSNSNSNNNKTQKGPVRASTNVRTTILTDYAPDVCKDYRKTGWCGFGDSCIFLHDRSDLKQGWQLDREWETIAKGRRELGGTVVSSAGQKSSKDLSKGSKAGPNDKVEEDDEEMLAKIPFVCIICEKPYRSPIVTRCGHYFCEPCALTRYRKDPSCKNCGAATGGVFNTATRLERLLKRKRAKEAETEEEIPG